MDRENWLRSSTEGTSFFGQPLVATCLQAALADAPGYFLDTKQPMPHPAPSARCARNLQGDDRLSIHGGTYRTEMPDYTLFNGRLPSAATKFRVYWAAKGRDMLTQQKKLQKSKLARALKTHKSAMERGGETDGNKHKPSQRYWSGKNAARTTDKSAPCIRLDTSAAAAGKQRRRRNRFDSLDAPESSNKIPLPASWDEGESWDEWAGKRRLWFNQQLRADPKNHDLWGRFLKFQDDLGGRQADGARGSAKGTRAAKERKLAVYEKAVGALPYSEDMWSGYAAAAAECLDPGAVEDIWDRALTRLPGSPGMWVQFAQWKMSVYSEFHEVRRVFHQAVTRLTSFKRMLALDHAEEVRKLESRRLIREALSADKPGEGADEEEEAAARAYEREVAELEEGLLQILSHAAAYERSAGFEERGIALFQAMVELNIHTPEDAPERWSDSMGRFEVFWDSEAPRVGEQGAQGWKAWSEARQGAPAPPQSRPAAAVPSAGNPANRLPPP
eukprot:gene3296-3801_t